MSSSAIPRGPCRRTDVALYGRVKATLDNTTVKLTTGKQQTMTWEFNLEAPPLLTMASFEVSNADGQAPLEITVNDQPVGPVTIAWPTWPIPAISGSCNRWKTACAFAMLAGCVRRKSSPAPCSRAARIGWC